MSDFPEPTPWNGGPDERRYDEDTQPNRRGISFGPAYVCVDCSWTGRQAHVHHAETGHAVRGRTWPASWPNSRFSDADADGRCLATMKRRA